MPRYLLIARDDGQAWGSFAESASPAQMQEVIEQYREWAERVASQGKLHGGEKLRDGEGRVMRGQGKGHKVTDGPFTDTKEVVGGYWVLEAASYEEAAQLAADSPHLRFGSLELREIEQIS